MGFPFSQLKETKMPACFAGTSPTGLSISSMPEVGLEPTRDMVPRDFKSEEG